MARHIKDLSLFLSALRPERMSALDPRTPPMPFAKAQQDLAGMRVGLLSDDGVLAPSRGYHRALSLAQAALEARGATVVPFHTNLCEEAVWLYLAVMSSDGARTMRELLEGEEVDPSLAGLLRVASLPQAVRGAVRRALSVARKPRMAKVLEALGEKTVTEVWKLHVRMRDVRARMLAAWDDAKLDVVLTPPAATPAVPHGGSQDFVLGITYTFVWNLMHFPAGVVPVTRVLAHEEEGRTIIDRFDKKAQVADTDSLGLPLGVQIVGRPYQEHKVLGMLEAIEAGVRQAPSFPSTPVDPRAA
jgi:fatty acid amide hydrolase